MPKTTTVHLLALLTSLAINTEFYLIQPIMLTASYKLSSAAPNQTTSTQEQTAHEIFLKYLMAMNIAQATTIFFVGYFMGLIADIYHCTKQIIAFQQIFNCFQFLLLILLYHHNDQPYLLLRLTILVNVLLGLTGGTLGFMTMIFAYISKKCSQSQQTVLFSSVEAWYTLGLIAAQILGGLTSQYLEDFMYGLLIAFVPLILSILATIGFLTKPESQTNEPVRGQKLTFNRIIKDIASYVQIAYTKRSRKQRCSIFLACLIIFLLTISIMGATTVTYSFLKKSPTSMTDLEVSIFIGLNQTSIFIGLRYLLPFLRHYMDDIWLCGLTIICRSTAYLLLVFAHNTYLVYATNLFNLLAGFEGSILRSFCRQQVHANEAARIFAVFSSSQSLGLIFSQSITKVHQISQRRFHRSAVFVACCVLNMICLALVGLVKLVWPETKKENQEDSEEKKAVQERLVAKPAENVQLDNCC